jgi:glycosyltransferase involved in cell wall biosynthesis
MKASDQEKVFSGWQIVPLDFHLQSKITWGEYYYHLWKVVAYFSLPLVLSDLPAFREIAGDSVCYFLPGDYQQLAGIIESLLKDSNKRMKLGKLAYARVNFSYGWDKMRARAKKEIIGWWRQLHCGRNT